MTDPSLTRSLTRRIRATPVAVDDLRQAELYVRDWLGALAAGGALETGAILRAYGRDSDDLEAKVFRAAALSHTAEIDDLHRASTTHPGCVVVPAALLAGRARDAAGERALRAVLAGYEAMLRVGEALGPGHYRTFHNTATAGVFGAAAAAASLLDLDEDGWVWAFGNAGTQAAGLWQFNTESAMSKPLHAGHAAQAGLRAALLAERGFSGASRILEGEKGFFAGFCPDPRPDAVLEPSDGWKLPETSFKPYPCCRHTHPAIDAALELRGELRGGGLEPADVDATRVSSYAAALRLTDDPRPASRAAAQFSIQFCVATALSNGRPDLDSFGDEALKDDGLRRLMESTSVGTDRALDRAYPERWGAEVELDTRDGRRFTAGREVPKGDPERPLTDAEIDRKVEDLCAFAGHGRERGGELVRASRELAVDGPLFALPWIDG